MTYVVTDNCIRCKYMDCVEVCPVDCFYEGENFLVIHPDECIDCGVCEPECPAEAIKPDTEPGLDKWLKINTEFASIWPNVTVKRDAMPEFMRGFGDFLKHRCAGSTAFVYFGDRALLKSLGLRTAWKKPLANGGLDGRVVRVDLFAGSRDAFEVARERKRVSE